MSQFEKASFLWDLKGRSQIFKEGVTSLVESLAASDLNWKPAENQWSIAQIVEHLVLTHDPYLCAIRDKFVGAEHGFETHYNGGWIGNYIVRKLEERPGGQVKQMYAPGNLRPTKSVDSPAIVAQLLEQIDCLEGALTRSRQLKLQPLKVPIPITKFLKVHIGDVFRFIIAHNERHLIQMERVKKQLIAANLLYSLSGNVVPSKINTRNLSSERP